MAKENVRGPGLGHNFANVGVQAPIQAKLTISQPDDQYEREADQVADEVMRMPEAGAPAIEDPHAIRPGIVARPVGNKITPLVQRQENTEEKEDEGREADETAANTLASGNPVQRQADTPESEEEKDTEEPVQTKRGGGQAPSVTAGVEAQLHRTQGQGASLPTSARAFFEPRFGHDFSQVRIHADADAASANHSLHAQAFTRGRDIYFARGRYQPQSASGRQLLAHELTHVVQQGSGATSPQVQRAPLVTGGQYGQELGEFMDNFMNEETEKKKLVAMLKGSPTFLSMAHFLDSRVLRASERDFTKFDFDEGGWLVTVRGKRPTDKRLLGFAISHAGSYFSPYGNNVPWLGDLINIQFPALWQGADEQLADLSSTIAHETGHAVRLIRGTTGRAPDAATAIKRGIAEEATVRKTEAKVMEEIRKKGLAQPAKAPTSKAEKIAAIESGVATADVERSFVSMKPTKTYLEMFLLEHVKASHKGKMTFDEVSKLKAMVDKIVIAPKLLDATYTLQDYAQAMTLMVLFGNDRNLPVNNLNYALYYLGERLIGLRWDRFMTDAREGRIAANDYFDQKEAILHGHLQFLQAGTKVAYAPRIAHAL